MKKKFSIANSSELFDFMSFAKCFSIICIVCFHLINDFMTSVPTVIRLAGAVGGTGVHIFFIASGTGLYFSYLRKPTNYIEFFKRRLSKIYIPYIIIVVISFFIPWYYASLDSRIGALCSHIFLYKMFVPAYEMSFGGQLWFVSTIIQLYIVFLPLCHLYKKLNYNSSLFFAINMSVSIIWWIFLFIMKLGDFRIWNSFFLQYLWEFALGMIIARHIYNGKTISIKTRTIVLMAFIGIGIEGVTGIMGGILRSFNDIFCAMGFFGIIAIIYLMNFNFLKRMLIKLSNVSYEIYLLHWLLFSIAFRYISIYSFWGQLLLGVATIILCIILSYLYSKVTKLIASQK